MGTPSDVIDLPKESLLRCTVPSSYGLYIICDLFVLYLLVYQEYPVSSLYPEWEAPFQPVIRSIVDS